jgi:hypothetical protein
MIKIEFQVPDDALETWETKAALIVHEDNSIEITGDPEIIDTTPAAPDLNNPEEWIRFADNPYKWAKAAKLIFRSPYLVPVITETSESR